MQTKWLDSVKCTQYKQTNKQTRKLLAFFHYMCTKAYTPLGSLTQPSTIIKTKIYINKYRWTPPTLRSFPKVQLLVAQAWTAATLCLALHSTECSARQSVSAVQACHQELNLCSGRQSVAVVQACAIETCWPVTCRAIQSTASAILGSLPGSGRCKELRTANIELQQNNSHPLTNPTELHEYTFRPTVK